MKIAAQNFTFVGFITEVLN